MTKKEAIDRWAKCVIPAVMMAESKLLEDKPVWREWLSHVTLENGSELADMYCREIAEIIVRRSGYDTNEKYDES